MSEPGWLPGSELARQASGRIGGHVRHILERWPGVLGELQRLAGLRGRPGIPDWPEWCWLPMTAVAQFLAGSGSSDLPADIGVVSAVGQWRLLGQHIVVPAADVAAAAVPGPAAAGAAAMDLRLPRDALLADLAGACLYLVMPAHRQPDAGMRVHGCYAHLEYDLRPGQGAELRLLVDHSEWGLVPVPVLLDQPTLAWSATAIAAGAQALPPEMAGRIAELNRALAWWVWPLLGALLNHDTYLARTAVLDGADTDPGVRGSQVWQISSTGLAPAAPPGRRQP